MEENRLNYVLTRVITYSRVTAQLLRSGDRWSLLVALGVEFTHLYKAWPPGGPSQLLGPISRVASSWSRATLADSELLDFRFGATWHHTDDVKRWDLTSSLLQWFVTSSC